MIYFYFLTVQLFRSQRSALAGSSRISKLKQTNIRFIKIFFNLLKSIITLKIQSHLAPQKFSTY